MERERKFNYLLCFIVMGILAAAIDAEEISETPSVDGVLLNDLMAKAAEQKSTEKGGRYWWQVFDKLDKLSDEDLMACVHRKPDPQKMYNYVLEIGEGGKIKKVHWDRVDEFSACIDMILLKISYPLPPESPFYFYLTEI